MERPEELRREAERLNLAKLHVLSEAQEVELAIKGWANKLGKELVGILERNGPDLPPAEAARFLRLLVLRSLLLGADKVNSLPKTLDSLAELLLQAERGRLPREEAGETRGGLDVSL